MASMNSGIILAGQPVDFASSIGRGIQAAGAQNQISRQNALANLYQQQGAGIANGDPRALNALAAYDPQAAMQAKATQQDMQLSQKRMDVLSAQEKRAAAEYAAGLSKAQREEEATKIETAVKMGMAAQDPQQWDALMGKMAPDLVGKFDQREMLGNRYMTLADILKQQQGPDPTKNAPSGYMWNDPKNPRAGVSQIPGYQTKPADDYGRYVQEENAAGRKPLTRLEFEQAKKGKGFSYTTPDGTTISFGGGADANSALSPSSPESMISSIDGILNDPALDSSTGIFAPLQNIPGTPMKRFGARAKQLEGQAFLQAFSSLKGGGQITEIEGQKATQAIGRLDTAQSADDYRAALTELRDILVKGSQRPKGWAEQQGAMGQSAEPQGGQKTQSAPQGDVTNMSDEEFLKTLGLE
ncbi:hypothetical protein [Thioclava sp. DLFJ4-1]|uniref:hypothetical protein n=1 Tax=Thioclava sp. DLFJ4-1 TaxID=1915313 RepID=UPI000998AC02|nr:hypothetical protein [Thioclava sp. DLFJ4-1]OOY15064.1 hypothetical protein BMI85_16075 [Thioclava sp. DLFJ4-1]